MPKWKVRIGTDIFLVDAHSRYNAKVSGARKYVAKYPKANLDTHKVVTQRKVYVSSV